MIKDRLLLASRRLLFLTVCGLLMVVVLLLGRAAFVGMFFPWSEIISHNDALPLMAFNIFRFDAQIAAYVLLLPTVLTLAVLFPVGERYARFLAAFNKIYFAVAASLLALLTVIDMGFYRNFGTHINLTFFDFFDEGPLGLLRTIWEEYSVISYALLIVLGFVAVYFLVGFLERKIVGSPKMSSDNPASAAPAGITRCSMLLSSVFLLLYIAGMVIAMRGSVWMYPLQEEDINVSGNKHVNDAVPNAVYMLKKAWKEKKNSFVIPSDDRLLADNGFSSLQEALDVWTGGSVVLSSDTLAALKDALFEDVPAADTLQKPNVLIILAESWSRYLFLLDHPGLDMGQGMERHFADDLFFPNIQSVQNGTVATIENITLSTPYPRVFRSRYRLQPLSTSIALPFKESGYATEFISGMNMEWENCGEAALRQQFDEATDKYKLLAEDRSYTHNGIGIYDEFLLNSIFNRLQNAAVDSTNRLADSIKNAAGTPRMMLAITTTNHPPFDFPADMQLPPIPAEVFADTAFAIDDREVLTKYINGFRYFNKSLCDFLDSFKASPAAENTIIIVTGDHNVRSILDYNVIGERYAYNVPLYIYLPPALRRDIHKAMTERVGSHDDILATLAPLALSNTRYFKMGNNLLSDTLSDEDFFSPNVARIIPSEGERKVKARDVLRNMYFRRLFELAEVSLKQQKQ